MNLRYTIKSQLLTSKIDWMRCTGLLILIFIAWKADLGILMQEIGAADLLLVLMALFLDILLIDIKTLRWLRILKSQRIVYAHNQAYLAYFGSIFIGLLTPGRWGELIKAAHVGQDCGVSMGRAFSGVLLDRICDILLLIGIGAIAFQTLTRAGRINWQMLIGLLGLFLVAAFFFNQRGFAFLQRLALEHLRLGRSVLGSNGWLTEIRQGLLQLDSRTLLSVLCLTLLAYTVFFSQCYLLAKAINLRASFIQITLTVSLGSLAALLPISIAGLGTREAAIITSMATYGISAEKALSFSLLIFFVFYLGGGLFGAIAWLIKPVRLSRDLNKIKSLDTPKENRP